MQTLPTGRSAFTLADPRPAPRRTVTVHAYRPERAIADAPVLLVMHGVKRNGEEYRDQWVETAERHGVIVAVPEFSVAQYAHPHEYNYGGMVAAESSWLRSAGEVHSTLGSQIFRKPTRQAMDTNEATMSTIHGLM